MSANEFFFSPRLKGQHWKHRESENSVQQDTKMYQRELIQRSVQDINRSSNSTENNQFVGAWALLNQTPAYLPGGEITPELQHCLQQLQPYFPKAPIYLLVNAILSANYQLKEAFTNMQRYAQAVNIVADRMHSTLGQQVSKPQIMEALQANNYNSNETTLQLLMKKDELSPAPSHAPSYPDLSKAAKQLSSYSKDSLSKENPFLVHESRPNAAVGVSSSGRTGCAPTHPFFKQKSKVQASALATSHLQKTDDSFQRKENSSNIENVEAVTDHIHSILALHVPRSQIREALQANNYNSDETTLQLLQKKDEISPVPSHTSSSPDLSKAATQFLSSYNKENPSHVSWRTDNATAGVSSSSTTSCAPTHPLFKQKSSAQVGTPTTSSLQKTDGYSGRKGTLSNLSSISSGAHVLQQSSVDSKVTPPSIRSKPAVSSKPKIAKRTNWSNTNTEDCKKQLVTSKSLDSEAHKNVSTLDASVRSQISQSLAQHVSIKPPPAKKPIAKIKPVIRDKPDIALCPKHVNNNIQNRRYSTPPTIDKTRSVDMDVPDSDATKKVSPYLQEKSLTSLPSEPKTIEHHIVTPPSLPSKTAVTHSVNTDDSKSTAPTVRNVSPSLQKKNIIPRPSQLKATEHNSTTKSYFPQKISATRFVNIDHSKSTVPTTEIKVSPSNQTRHIPSLSYALDASQRQQNTVSTTTTPSDSVEINNMQPHAQSQNMLSSILQQRPLPSPPVDRNTNDPRSHRPLPPLPQEAQMPSTITSDAVDDSITEALSTQKLPPFMHNRPLPSPPPGRNTPEHHSIQPLPLSFSETPTLEQNVSSPGDTLPPTPLMEPSLSSTLDPPTSPVFSNIEQPTTRLYPSEQLHSVKQTLDSSEESEEDHHIYESLIRTQLPPSASFREYSYPPDKTLPTAPPEEFILEFQSSCEIEQELSMPLPPFPDHEQYLDSLCDTIQTESHTVPSPPPPPPPPPPTHPLPSTTPSHSEPLSATTTNDSHASLMSSIRQAGGTNTLKRSCHLERSSANVDSPQSNHTEKKSQANLASALQKVLAEREKQIQGDDDSSESESEYGWT